jgi:hypothetical protein
MAARAELRAFVLLMSVLWSHPNPTSCLQDAAPAADPDSQARTRLREAGRRVVGILRREQAKPAGRPQDVRGRAELLGFDPARIFEFVQKKIRFEPYPGLQRGAAGVLVSRAGNSADKSLLLAELLRASGYEARMVRGPLRPERAQELAARSLAEFRERKPAAYKGAFGGGEISKARIAGIAAEAGLSLVELEGALESMDQARRRSWSEVLSLAARERAFLEDEIRTARLEAAPRSIHEEVIRSLEPHYSVQWRARGSAAWTPLDPCFESPDPAPRAPAGSEEVNPSQVADRFRLNLSLERSAGGKRETVDVLKVEIPVYEALLRPVRFQINPTGFKVPSIDGKVSMEGFFNQLAAYREFQAALYVGDETFGSRVFDYDGKVSKINASGQVEVAGKMAGGVQRGFGGFGGLGGSSAEPGDKGALQKLWVDLSVDRGRVTLWSQRRAILEEAHRPTWCPVLEWNLFFQSHEISPRFLHAMIQRNRIDNDGLIQAGMDWAESNGSVDIRPAFKRKVRSYPTDLAEFALARQAYLAQLGEQGRRLYFDKPNLFISGQQARLKADSKSICMCTLIDIVENGALVLAAGDQYSIDRGLTTALGILDTVLEQEFMRRINPREPVVGAVSIFERARALSVPLRFIRMEDEPSLIQAGLPTEDVARMRAHQGERIQVLAAPGVQEHCGGGAAWWTFDPQTGRTLGIISGGRGGAESRGLLPQALVEYLFDHEVIGKVGAVMCMINTAVGLKKEATAKSHSEQTNEKAHIFFEGMLCIFAAFFATWAHVLDWAAGQLVIEGADLLFSLYSAGSGFFSSESGGAGGEE